MRIVAILASYNEGRFMRACLEHYLQQGIEVYLLDNESTDDTVDIAQEYSNQHVIGIETIPRGGLYQWNKILLRKEVIADQIKADWLMHADPDEIRVAPNSSETLAEAIARVDGEGYNAINFMEYTFLPVHESDDHDHPDFQKTMRWYYPFSPRHPHRLNAWKRQPQRWPGLKSFAREVLRHRRWTAPSVDLHSTGGHLVDFPGIKPYPDDFKLKHYIVLSLGHAIQKYVKKDFAPEEIDNLHGWRATAAAHDFSLPSQNDMRVYTTDDDLDASHPLAEHLLVSRTH
ncbi:MAG: glycosyltransferase family 2 protein [Lamprobacter sp.]|uniref:glycosyltransferase family 2 protein n=1 Tax=Lamprobacter sp. TaxID=3100796 RepID=UPI002B25C8F9|nr:glycosyltransferase family 2 protein [Lamprobacter sp.]MEA3642639.1 glycosyltransferase family 2 protein [Lamprobacter sp.]